MHFLFASTAGSGHVNPTLPLVSELVDRGHRVSYVTDGRRRAEVEGAGAALLPTMPVEGEVTTFDTFGPDLMIRRVRHLIAETRANLPVLLKRFEQDRPDVVCYDVTAMLGWALAAKLAVPDIALVPVFASNEHFSLFRGIREKVGESTIGQVGQELAAAAAGLGLPEWPSPFTPMSADQAIVFLPREFQHAGETFDDSYHFVGPSLGKRARSDDWQAPERPLLFISLGTVFNDRPDFYRLCVEAFGDSRWEVAMSTGAVDPAALGELPANFDVRASFPQPSVLRDAEVFVTHAGMNSTMEALLFGVPTVGVPQQPEQEANAARVEELRLGRRLGEISVESLRAAVDEVAGDAEMRGRLADMRAAIEKAGGSVAAADIVERRASSR